MENIIESYLPYIDKELFSAILDKVDQLSFNKSGLNSKCSIVGNYAILRTDNIPGHDDSFIRIINSLHELKQKGINVVPILGFGILKKGMPFASGKRFDSGYIIQEKAEGQELLCPNVLRGRTDEDCRVIVKEYLDMLRNAPQEHFNKWLSDFKEIGASNISIDPSKESNFFYDKDKGFSFIDLNFFDDVKKEDNRHRIDFIQYSFTPFNRFFRGNMIDIFKMQKIWCVLTK